MLLKQQIKFRDRLLSLPGQSLYFLKYLPMGLISGIKLKQLDEAISISEVPFRWCNKNPFNSMYFAVQSMAAELSTAAPALMALKNNDADIAFIIVGLKAEFLKKAQSKITFSCMDYSKLHNATSQLSQPGDTVAVTAKTVGRDADNNEVALFYFTWSFKVRSR